MKEDQSNRGDVIQAIRNEVRRGTHRFTLHAGDRMTMRHISVREVEEALVDVGAEAIEDYAEDPRGPSCLILGTTRRGRMLHVRCSYPPRVAVITAYDPDPAEWIDWRRRKGV